MIQHSLAWYESHKYFRPGLQCHHRWHWVFWSCISQVCLLCSRNHCQVLDTDSHSGDNLSWELFRCTRMGLFVGLVCLLDFAVLPQFLLTHLVYSKRNKKPRGSKYDVWNRNIRFLFSYVIICFDIIFNKNTIASLTNRLCYVRERQNKSLLVICYENNQ